MSTPVQYILNSIKCSIISWQWFKDRHMASRPGEDFHVEISVQIQAVAAAEGRLAVQQHTTIETVLNMTPENKEHFLSEKEAIFLLLTGIGDEIYSTVDACHTANEMWIAIERLQQGESLNVQDVKTNLFWEFGKFTSRNGESMESYYSWFFKLMNELTRNNLEVIIMQQFQKEVNDIRAERIAKSANPLALLAAAQPYSDNYYQAPKPQRLMHIFFTRPRILNKLRGNLRTCKRIWHSLQIFQKLYKPFQQTTSNFFQLQEQWTKDYDSKYNNENQSRQFRNSQGNDVAGNREIVRSQERPKRGLKDMRSKEKIMMCKQDEQGGLYLKNTVQLKAIGTDTKTMMKNMCLPNERQTCWIQVAECAG
ncbi:hypothetical protein Tco_0833814 [Tanacetum coccineum]